MWSRRQWGRACAWGVMAAAMPSLRAQTASAPAPNGPTPPRGATRLAIAVDHRASFCYLPLTIAERLGYFAQEGLDVELREFPDALQSLQAVQGGVAHVLSGSYANTIALQARGHSFQSFVLQGRTPQVVVGVSLDTMGHYRSLADLRGRRVGVMSTSAASLRVASLVLSKAGLRSSDVQYVPLANPSAAVQAFRRGELDAISSNDLTLSRSVTVRDTLWISGHGFVMAPGCTLGINGTVKHDSTGTSPFSTAREASVRCRVLKPSSVCTCSAPMAISWRITARSCCSL